MVNVISNELPSTRRPKRTLTRGNCFDISIETFRFCLTRIKIGISGFYRGWDMPDYSSVTNVGLTQLTNGKNSDAGPTFFRYPTKLRCT